MPALGGVTTEDGLQWLSVPDYSDMAEDCKVLAFHSAPSLGTGALLGDLVLVTVEEGDGDQKSPSPSWRGSNQKMMTGLIVFPLLESSKPWLMSSRL
jgi:hypothetical protein